MRNPLGIKSERFWKVSDPRGGALHLNDWVGGHVIVFDSGGSTGIPATTASGGMLRALGFRAMDQ